MNKFLFLVVVVCSVSACKAVQEEKAQTQKSPKALPLEAQTLWQSTHCQAREEGARIISNVTELAAWWEKIHNRQLPQPGLAKELASVDFSETQLVVVNMGEKPTAGYGLDLDKQKSGVDNGQLLLSFHRLEPAADSMQAQVLTQPCTVLQISKEFEDVVLRFIH